MGKFKWGIGAIALAGLIITGRMVLPGAVPDAASSAEPAGSGAYEVIMYVNGEPVTRQEFQLYMDQEKGAVTNEFSVNYGAEDRKGYWTATFGGGRPIDRLKSLAAAEAAKGKTLQILARSHGLAVDSEFMALLKSWSDGNERRTQEMQAGKAVFGLGQYDLSQYYFYTLSNLQLQLEESLGKAELEVGEDELQQVYEDHAADYQNQERLEIQELAVPYSSEAERASARETVQAALESLNSGETPEAVTVRLPQIRLSTNTAVVDDRTNPLSAEAALIETARRLAEGEWSAPFDLGGSYSAVRLLRRTQNYAVPLEEVAGQLRAEALDRKFAAYLEQQYSLAEVRLEQANYDAITTP